MPELEIFKDNLLPMEVWHHRAMQKVRRWANGTPEGYSTGFKAMDRFTRLVGPDLTVIAGRPSMGKTQLSMQIVENVARQLQANGDRGCVAIFSAEMAGWDLHMRCASALSGVNTQRLRQGQGTQQEISDFTAALETISQLPIWIDDNSGPTTSQMLTQLRWLNDNEPVRLMMFDFLELGGDRGNIEHLRVGQIAQSLKGIAKTLGIPVIAISQLSREVEERANKMPNLSDLRQSGMIEQIADVVVFIMRPEYYIERKQKIDVPNEDKQGIAYVQYAKNRNGDVGLTKLAFVKERVRFAELASDVLPGVRR